MMAPWPLGIARALGEPTHGARAAKHTPSTTICLLRTMHSPGAAGCDRVLPCVAYNLILRRIGRLYPAGFELARRAQAFPGAKDRDAFLSYPQATSYKGNSALHTAAFGCGVTAVVDMEMGAIAL